MVDKKTPARVVNDQLPPYLVDVDFLKEVTADIPIKGVTSPYRLFRYDKIGDRYYFRYINGKPKGYLSMTSFTQKVLPTSQFLIRWMQDMGVDGAEYQKNMKSEYGTMTHIMTTDVERNGGGNWDTIKRDAFANAIDLGYKHEAMEWEEGAVNDLLSYMVFRTERNVETIAAEIPICSDEFDLAGCIDRVVRMTFGRKTINAIIDWKSGRKGFFDSHILQLHGYKVMWNDLFGDVFPVTHVFNLAPAANSLKAKTKYKLTNQTDACIDGRKVPVREWVRDQLAMAKKSGMVNPPMSHMELRGDFSLNNFDFTKNIVEQKI